MSSRTVREQILVTASDLFYREGVHAVGVDTIIAQAGVAKSSLYRYFRTKDDLIAEFVRSEDEAFWQQWDRIAAPESADPRAMLFAVLNWIGSKIATPGYRGCPQLNVVAEFPDASHPAREVATNHKVEMRRRFLDIATCLGVDDPELVADQLWLLVDGAFVNADLLAPNDPAGLLVHAATGIIQR